MSILNELFWKNGIFTLHHPSHPTQIYIGATFHSFYHIYQEHLHLLKKRQHHNKTLQSFYPKQSKIQQKTIPMLFSESTPRREAMLLNMTVLDCNCDEITLNKTKYYAQILKENGLTIINKLCGIPRKNHPYAKDLYVLKNPDNQKLITQNTSDTIEKLKKGEHNNIYTIQDAYTKDNGEFWESVCVKQNASLRDYYILRDTMTDNDYTRPLPFPNINYQTLDNMAFL